MKFLIFLLICSNLCSGQKKIEQYHNLINKAELEIVGGNYETSIKYYSIAFSKSATPFNKDLYNYLICGLFTNNYKAIDFSTKILKSRNVKLDYLTTSEKYDTLAGQKTFKEIFAKQSYQVKYNKSRALMDSLILVDQKIRSYYSDQLNNNKIDRTDTLIYCDSMNIILLENFFNEDLFNVSEEVCGNLSSGATTEIIFYLILNHRVYHNKGLVLENLLYLAMKKGYFHPQLFARLTDKCRNFSTPSESEKIIKKYGDFGTFKIFVVNEGFSPENYHHATKKLGEITYTENEKESINKARKNIFLESIDDLIKKAEFQINNPFFRFIYPDLIPVY